MARTLTGQERSNHVPIETLLNAARIPSYNHLSIRAAAMEVWKAWVSCDGPGGTRNTLGGILFRDDDKTLATDSSRKTRGATKGHMTPPLPLAADCLAYNGYRIWNNCEALREARTVRQARVAATALAMQAPL